MGRSHAYLTKTCPHISEACGLKWRDLDFNSGVVTFSLTLPRPAFGL